MPICLSCNREFTPGISGKNCDPCLAIVRESNESVQSLIAKRHAALQARWEERPDDEQAAIHQQHTGQSGKTDAMQAAVDAFVAQQLSEGKSAHVVTIGADHQIPDIAAVEPLPPPPPPRRSLTDRILRRPPRRAADPAPLTTKRRFVKLEDE